jgi:GTPase SAR1 family protein
VLGGKQVRVVTNFFSLAGAPEYAKIRAEFFSQEFEGLLLCFSLSDKKSFESLEQWLTEASSIVEIVSKSDQTLEEIVRIEPGRLKNKKIVVIGNKLDLKSDRAVSEKEARAWCSSKGFEYFEASAKTGENVIAAFTCLLNGCYSKPVPSTSAWSNSNQPGSTEASPQLSQRNLASNLPASSTAVQASSTVDMTGKQASDNAKTNKKEPSSTARP